jgi:FkbM family methyltransferase
MRAATGGRVIAAMNDLRIPVVVRGVRLALMGGNRSLELCARMNYETENLDFIDALPRGAIYFDLGACEGRFSLYAAAKGLRVFAFEPERDNFSALERNIRLNGLEDRITAFNVGVGDFNGTSRMNIGQPWPGGHQKVIVHGTVRSDLSFDFVAQQEVRVARLDDLMRAERLPLPAALKIDIDGSELPFVSGARELLANPALRSLVIELKLTDPGAEAIVDVLCVAGFQERSRHPVPNEPGLFNVVFVRDVPAVGGAHSSGPAHAP